MNPSPTISPPPFRGPSVVVCTPDCSTDVVLLNVCRTFIRRVRQDRADCPRERLPAAVRDRGRGLLPSTAQTRKARTTLTSGARLPSTFRVAPSLLRDAFTLVPSIMDMGVAKLADGAQAPLDSTFDEINRMFSKLGFIDYNSRLAQGPFYSPNLICLSHASWRRGGAFSRESIPVLLVRIPTCPYACCSAAFETSKPFDFRN